MSVIRFSSLLFADSFSVWIILAIVAASVAVGYVCWRYPYRIFIRLPLWIVMRIFYRVRTIGLDNVPREGPALLVSNHVSHIDALLIMARIKRPVRFLIWADFLNVFWLRPFLRLARVIPVKSTGARSIVQSLRTAAEALARGELVCIFAEGGITRIGFIVSFHRGLERIVKQTPAPIIPVYLHGVWGSVFSYSGGRFFWKLPKRFPYPVTVTFGPPMPPTSTAAEVRKEVQRLSAEAAIACKDELLPVHRRFVRMASRHPFRPCFIDPTNKDKPILRYCEVLTGVKILARRLRPLLDSQEMVGLWLPPTPGGAIANIVAAVLGKAAVNLNYSVSQEVVRSAIAQCGIRKIVTSRLFLKKMPLDPGEGVELIALEDFRKDITASERIRTLLGVLITPWFIQERWVMGLSRHRPSDLATVIFSSGSTGEPKGVMLTHANIAANAQSAIQVIDPKKNDRLLAILPFFHSFGYTVALWLPLQAGASTVFYPNPLASKEIGQACRDFGCTLFISTPTFLRSYLKRCSPDDFRTLRVLICGAEKLPRSLAEEFRDRFGVEPLEGYGCTELSPVVATNVPDWEMPGYKQIGHKPGTIGRPLPGVAAMIVDPESKAERGFGEEGMLLVRGANVMKGYLHKPELTAKKMHNGWYITGDLGALDEDGFITLTGRLERFAKVGGEMVPLERIEEELHQIFGTNDRICVVTAIPDEKKGERVVVLCRSLDDKNVEELRQQLRERGLPPIYIPGPRDFFIVDDLPILGSGKVDLKKCKELAMTLAAEACPVQ